MQRPQLPWTQQEILFPLSYRLIRLRIDLHISADEDLFYFGSEIRDPLRDDEIIAKVAVPAWISRGSAPVGLLAAEAYREALRHLDPFPAP